MADTYKRVREIAIKQKNESLEMDAMLIVNKNSKRAVSTNRHRQLEKLEKEIT